MTKTDERALFFLEEEGARPPQKEAVTASAPLVVVSAGAGTGKTRTLAWRFAWLVATGRARFDQILTLTFTEKAALEMRQRIGKTLQEWGKRCPHEMGESKALLLEGASAIEEARISTIHSFASSLIKEGGFSLDLPGKGRIVSAPEEERFWNGFARGLNFLDREWFSALLGKGSLEGESPSQGLLEELYHLLESSGGTDVLNEFSPAEIARWCKNAGELWRSMGRSGVDFKELMEHPGRAYEDPFYLQIRQGILVRWEQLGKDVLDMLKSLALEGKSQTVQGLREFLHNWPAPPSGESLPHFFLALLELFSGRKAGKEWALFSKHFQALTGQKPADWRKAREKHEKALAQVTTSPGMVKEDNRLRQVLLGFGLLGWFSWKAYCAGQGLLTFDDLIFWASRSVEESPQGGLGFKAILVDEFQDTDPLQDRLIESLLRKNRPLYGTSLFLVGDVKQSIYRFRHAEPGIFARYIAQAQQGEGHYVQLDESFRSSQGILEVVNGFFGNLWRNGLGEALSLPYEKLRTPKGEKGEYLLPEREKAPEVPALTHLFDALTEDGEGKLLPLKERRRILARRLGEFFLTLRGRSIWDKEEGISRGCTFRDMAVLLPSRSGYGDLEEAFGSLHIPVRLEKSLDYFSRGEVLDALNWLKTLGNPGDNLALGGFLSSPFSLLCLEEVQKLLERFRLKEFPTLWEGLREHFPKVYAHIEAARRKAFFGGPRKALVMLLENPEPFGTLSPYLRKRSLVNLRLGVELTGEYEAAYGPDILGCAAWMERAISGKPTRVEEPQPLGPEEDAVRVMTIHASKGLEFPVVALFGLEQNYRGKKSDALVTSRVFGVAPSRYPEPWEVGFPPLSRPLGRLLEMVEEEEERQRLFYVGCTRAQDALVLCGVPHKVGEEGEVLFSPTSYLSWYLPWAYPKGLWKNHLVSDGDEEYADREEEELHDEVAEIPEPLFSSKALELPQVDAGGLATLSAASYGLMRYCPRAWQIRYRQGQELFWDFLGNFPGEPGGADLGSLVHWVLRHWDFDCAKLERFLPQGENPSLPPGLPLEYRRVFREKSFRDTARTWLESLGTSSRGKHFRKLSGEQCLNRESFFRLEVPQGPTLTGIIDLWYREEETLHIWDYKTGQRGFPRTVPGRPWKNVSGPWHSSGSGAPSRKLWTNARPVPGKELFVNMMGDLAKIERYGLFLKGDVVEMGL